MYTIRKLIRKFLFKSRKRNFVPFTTPNQYHYYDPSTGRTYNRSHCNVYGPYFYFYTFRCIFCVKKPGILWFIHSKTIISDRYVGHFEYLGAMWYCFPREFCRVHKNEPCLWEFASFQPCGCSICMRAVKAWELVLCAWLYLCVIIYLSLIFEKVKDVADGLPRFDRVLYLYASGESVSSGFVRVHLCATFR